MTKVKGDHGSQDNYTISLLTIATKGSTVVDSKQGDIMTKDFKGIKRGQVDEISDILTDKAFEEMHVGQILKFSTTTLRITKIWRKKKRAWAEHIQLFSKNIVGTHYGHLVDSTEEAFKSYGSPFCDDCQVPVSSPSTEDGDKKAMDRKDYLDEHTLPDGTIIDEA